MSKCHQNQATSESVLCPEDETLTGTSQEWPKPTSNNEQMGSSLDLSSSCSCKAFLSHEYDREVAKEHVFLPKAMKLPRKSSASESLQHIAKQLIVSKGMPGAPSPSMPDSTAVHNRLFTQLVITCSRSSLKAPGTCFRVRAQIIHSLGSKKQAHQLDLVLGQTTRRWSSPKKQI